MIFKGVKRMTDAKHAKSEGECPECGGMVTIAAGTEVSELLECPDCGSELEVKSLNPAKLDLAPKEEEDWGE